MSLAVKGYSTDYKAVTDIFAGRSNQQRQEIARFFKKHVGNDLVEDLKGSLTGHYQELVMALIRKPIEYLCMQLHMALTSKRGVKTAVLVEILCFKNNSEIAEIVREFETSELFIAPNRIVGIYLFSSISL